MRPDPPIRKDGLCVVCWKPRKPERSAKYGQGEADLDPFCSSPCCRVWHGTTLPESNLTRAQRKIAEEVTA